MLPRLKALAPAAALAFVLAFVSPTTVYYFNSDGFKFPLIEHAGLFAGMFAAVFALLFIISLAGRRVSALVAGLAIIGTATLLFINFMLPSDVGALDGRPVFDGTLLSDRSLWIFLVTLLVFAVLFFTKRKLVRDFVLLGSILSVLFVAYVMVISDKTAAGVPDTDDLGPYFSISSSRNVLVLSFDSIQTNVLAQVFEKYPELAQPFTGFTSYTDVSSVAPATIFSLLSTVSGSLPATGESGGRVAVVRKKLIGKSFMRQLEDHGYTPAIYGTPSTGHAPVDKYSYERILGADSVRVIESEDLVLSGLLRVLPVSVSPAVTRRVRMLFEPLRTGQISSLASAVAADDIRPIMGMDFLGFSRFAEGLVLTDEPVAKFYHFIPTHQPFKFDSSCNYIGTELASQSLQGAEQEVVCILSVLGELIANLKRLGAYDNTLFIIASDHGYGRWINPEIESDQGQGRLSLGVYNENGHRTWGSAGRYMPILLVKPFGASGALVADAAPVSLIDVAPTVCGQTMDAAVCADSSYRGFDLTANKPVNGRSRSIIVFEGGKDHRTGWLFETTHYKTIQFSGTARDEIPKLLKPLPALSCGDKLVFDSPAVWNKVAGDGFFRRLSKSGVGATGEQARLLFRYDGGSCLNPSVRVQSGVFSRTGSYGVSVEVSMNGKPIGRLHFDSAKGNSGARTVSLPIPADTLFSDEPNLIEFEISENAALGEGDSEDATRRKSWRLMAFSLQPAGTH